MIAKDIIHNWSETNSEFQKVILLPLHWSTNSFPEMGAHPQKIIDRQIVDKSDLLVCIFSSKIGTATDTSESGSIEEIEEHIRENKPVMLYFRKNIDISSITPDTLKKLQDFKRSIKNRALWWEYSDETEFKDIFKQHLQEFLNQNWLKVNQNNGLDDNKEQHSNASDVSFEAEELNMFYKWSNATDQTYVVVYDRTGFTVYMGLNNGYHFNKGKEEAEFNDFLHRLLDVGYIEEKRKDNKGNIIYAITKKGFDFAQTLSD